MGSSPMVLADEQRLRLSELAASRTAPVREVERAGILLKYAQGLSISEIQRQLGVSRSMIYKCIDKALAAGVQAGLKDAYHRPHAPEITDEAKAWVVSIACTQPKALWLAAELWSISALARYVSEHAEPSGFPQCLRLPQKHLIGISGQNQCYRPFSAADSNRYQIWHDCFVCSNTYLTYQSIYLHIKVSKK